MQFGRLTRGPRRVLVLFVTVTVVPVGALAWLSWHLLQQDRELENQRLRDKLDRAAELVVSALNRRLTEIGARLEADMDGLSRGLPHDAIVVRFGPKGIESLPPGRLLYAPSTPTLWNRVPDEFFSSGDELEYRREDFVGAIAFFREQARSPDPDVRAAALLRLATNYTKNRQPAEALVTYKELERLGPRPLRDGTPADLLARKAQCTILRELGRTEELLHAAQALNADFERGRWVLDKGSYHHYFDDAAQMYPETAQPRRPSPEHLVLAEAAGELWNQWRESGAERQDGVRWNSVRISGRPVLTLYRTAGNQRTALVAGPDYLESQWSSTWKDQGVALTLLDSERRAVLGQLPPDVTVTERKAADTGLPWTLRVASADPAADSAAFETRRRLLWGGLSLMALLTVLGGYSTARAAAREFAVARLQSDFVSAVSHEFRTPLTSLRHMTELLWNDTVLTDNRRRQYYAVMAHETERLHRLVEGLLAFGRMEALGSGQTFEAVDPVELAENTVAEFHAGAHRVELTANGVGPKSSFVRANREALSRALRNLLENAVKYSPDSPLVAVRLARIGDCVAIQVHDDGFGIPTEEQKTIFDKFVRGAAARALNVPGTGIGLAMTQHIVQAHGGKLLLESEPGHGTTFTIQLPVAGS